MITFTIITNVTLCAQSKKILFILSTADTLELNKGQILRQTGVFLNEFYLAYRSVLEKQFRY